MSSKKSNDPVETPAPPIDETVAVEPPAPPIDHDAEAALARAKSEA